MRIALAFAMGALGSVALHLVLPCDQLARGRRDGAQAVRDSIATAREYEPWAELLSDRSDSLIIVLHNIRTTDTTAQASTR